jgi:leucine dehydrogenase
MSVFDQMINRGHERVAFHHDPATGLRAIVAIHNTVLGNALGGTRRWYYETEEDALYDVLRLSQGMTYKSAAAGLPMGGAKSVIMMSKPGQKATEAEARAMGRFVDTFQGVYIAAEDVGVNTQFVDWMALETKHVMGGEKVSIGGDPSPHTAQGVVNAMKAALKYVGKNGDFKGLTVALQGVGNVGYNVAKILSTAGAKILAADINPTNLEKAVRECGVKAVTEAEILTCTCDILAPCALGGVIDGHIANQLNCAILCPGANNVLDDPDEDAVILKGRDIVYVPDFIANAGGVIHLAGLYLGYTPQQLAQKVADIETTAQQVLQDAESASITAHAAAVKVAERKIAEGVTSKRGGGSCGPNCGCASASASQPQGSSRQRMVAG